MKNEFYVYVYLNPLEKINKEYCGFFFDFEPIYIGKGKGKRYLFHAKASLDLIKKERSTKSLKLNTIKKYIREIGFEEYVSNYIVKIKENITNEESLIFEEELINKIGTIYEVPLVEKRGPLTNLVRGGISNPILKGENNPMHNKSIFSVWKSKMNEEEFEKKYNDYCERSRESLIKFHQNIDDNKKKEISKKISESNKGERHYKRRLNEEELKEIENKRLNAWKNSFENRTSQQKEEISRKMSKAHKERWDLKTEEEKQEFINRGILARKKYWENLTEEEKKEIGNAHKERWNLKTEEEKQEFSNKISNENHYLYQYNKSLYKYIEEKYGKERSEQIKSKYSEIRKGESNGMYGKGHLLTGSKNGRAIIVLVHFPDGRKYICQGTFKKMTENILSKYKPMPHRKYPADGNYYEGWMFKKIKSLEEINIEEYEKFE